MPEQFPINRWGWIEQINMESFPLEVPSLNKYGAKEYIADVGSIEITVRAPYRAEIIDTLFKFARNGRSPSWAEEWVCLYCASPNELSLTHCSQCGGPRNWILG